MHFQLSLLSSGLSSTVQTRTEPAFVNCDYLCSAACYMVGKMPWQHQEPRVCCAGRSRGA